MKMYLLIIVCLTFIALISTLLVGFSKENKKGNPDYDKKSLSNTVRLTLLYVVCGAVLTMILIYYM